MNTNFTARPATDSDGPQIDGAWIIEKGDRFVAVVANGGWAVAMVKALNHLLNVGGDK